jgi:hypothetical protein
LGAQAPIFILENIMNNIRLFRLVSGEEVVGEENGTQPGMAKRAIKNPCLIGLMPTPTGGATLNMQPLLLFSDTKEINIKEDHILYDTGVDIKILNKYNEIFGSGIVIAQQTPTFTR